MEDDSIMTNVSELPSKLAGSVLIVTASFCSIVMWEKLQPGWPMMVPFLQVIVFSAAAAAELVTKTKHSIPIIIFIFIFFFQFSSFISK
jgi:hypothetical protein